MEHGVTEALSCLDKEFRLVEGSTWSQREPIGQLWRTVDLGSRATYRSAQNSLDPEKFLSSDHFGLQLRRST